MRHDILVTIAMATACSTAGAATFSDRSLFEAALATFTIDDYEDLENPDIIVPSVPMMAGRPGYSVADTGFASLSLDAFPSSVGATGLDNDTVGGILNQQNALIITFDSPVTAAGFDYATNNTVLEARIDALEVSLPPATEGFFGYTSATPFTELRVFNDSTANAAFAIDNLTFGAVPEPASAAILLLGGLTLGTVRQLRRG